MSPVSMQDFANHFKETAAETPTSPQTEPEYRPTDHAAGVAGLSKIQSDWARYENLTNATDAARLDHRSDVLPQESGSRTQLEPA